MACIFPSGYEQSNALQHQVLNQFEGYDCVIRDSISADKTMESIITGDAAIDVQTSSSLALSAFFNLKSRWTRYLLDSSEIARKVDSVYVVACIVPGAALLVFPAVAPGAPVLTPLHGSGYASAFPSEPTAAFWCGSVRDNYPALRLWRFTCAYMCVQW